MYRLTFSYVTTSSIEIESRNQAFDEYLKMMEDPNYQNVQLLVTEEREVTDAEIYNATKDRPGRTAPKAEGTGLGDSARQTEEK